MRGVTGYGTEAARLMLRLAFERIGLHRVGLSVFAFNERAIRSYQKAGFRVEGRLREAIARDGRYWDEIQMGVLRDEWLAAAGAPRRRRHRRQIGQRWPARAARRRRGARRGARDHRAQGSRRGQRP